MAELFGILSGVVVLAAGPPYLIDILRGHTKPQRTAWFIWTALSVIAFVSQLQLGAHWSLLYSALNAAGNLLVFLLSLKYGVGGWNVEDVVGLIIALGGTLVSIQTSAPLAALWGVVLADAVGTVLTLYKTYKLPSSETSITWFFIGTSSLFGALSVGSWNASLLLYPAYMTFASYAVLVAQFAGGLARHRRLGVRKIKAT